MQFVLGGQVPRDVPHVGRPQLDDFGGRGVVVVHLLLRAGGGRVEYESGSSPEVSAFLSEGSWAGIVPVGRTSMERFSSSMLSFIFSTRPRIREMITARQRACQSGLCSLSETGTRARREPVEDEGEARAGAARSREARTDLFLLVRVVHACRQLPSGEFCALRWEAGRSGELSDAPKKSAVAAALDQRASRYIDASEQVIFAN